MSEILTNALDYLEKANPYKEANEPNSGKKIPEYIADNAIGYNQCLSKLKIYISERQSDMDKYKLPGHDETMQNLDNLKIR